MTSPMIFNKHSRSDILSAAKNLGVAYEILRYAQNVRFIPILACNIH
jgi:hypothetical protein